MKRPTSILSWLGIALVALPMSPCALVAGICVDHGVKSDSPAHQASHVRSCCSKSADLPDSNSTPVKPCSRGCCKVSPTGLTVEKITASQDALWLPAVETPLAVASAAESLVQWTAPSLPAVTLQSLACLWRC